MINGDYHGRMVYIDISVCCLLHDGLHQAITLHVIHRSMMIYTSYNPGYYCHTTHDRPTFFIAVLFTPVLEPSLGTNACLQT